MKLSMIAKPLLVLTLCCALACAYLWWQQQQQLQQHQQQYQDYQQLKQTISVDIQRNILQYLNQGQTQFLSYAQLDLAKLELLSADVDSYLSQQIQSLTKVLNDDLSHKYLAAGKLSANPYQLLEYSEQQLQGYSEDLANYALLGAATDHPQAMMYAMQVTHFQGQLARLRETSHQLSAYDSNQEIQIVRQYERVLNSFASLSPRPALYAEQEGNLDNELGAKADEALHEMRSLLKRYPKELSNTQTQLAATIESEHSLQNSISELEQLVLAFEQPLQQTQREQQAHAQQWQWGFIGSLILSLLLLWLSHNKSQPHRAQDNVLALTPAPSGQDDLQHLSAATEQLQQMVAELKHQRRRA